MMVTEGKLLGTGKRFAIIGSRFNEFITSKLIGGAMDALLRHDVAEENINTIWVPGAFEIPIVAKDGITNGHGGGDDGIVYSLYEYLTGEYQGFSVSDIRTSVNNHLIVFAAEESRANGTVVDFDTFVENLR